MNYQVPNFNNVGAAAAASFPPLIPLFFNNLPSNYQAYTS